MKEINNNTINWFPGHMAKALREMEEKIKLVDLVIVLLDARIPYSSFNPELKRLLGNKKTLYVLTKVDKADNIETNKWLSYYGKDNMRAIGVDARNSATLKVVEKESTLLLKEKREKDAKKGLKPRPIRTMITGIPNVGKSTLINTLCKKKVAQVGDKPGVTKSQQWTRINQNLELLDTPGVLWPKFEDKKVASNLAITGAIKDTVLSLEDVAVYFLDFLKEYYPNRILERYQVEECELSVNTLEKIGESLHFYLGNKDVDLEKTAQYLLQEFRNGYLGKITLDRIKL